MQLLIMDNKNIIAVNDNISFGFWDASPDYYKWRIGNGTIGDTYYVLDSNRDAITSAECDFKVHYIEALPDDYKDGLYFLIDGEFVKNPDYVEYIPPMNEYELSQKVREQDDSISELYEFTADLLYNQCLNDLGITESEVI